MDLATSKKPPLKCAKVQTNVLGCYYYDNDTLEEWEGEARGRTGLRFESGDGRTALNAVLEVAGSGLALSNSSGMVVQTREHA